MSNDYERFLEARGVETPCKHCSGLGTRAYGSTATWRGDIGWLRPLDRLLMYPDGEGAGEYVRTPRKWKCHWNGWVHTVFQFVKRVESGEKNDE